MQKQVATKKKKIVIEDMDEFYKNLALISMVVGELLYFIILGNTQIAMQKGDMTTVLELQGGFWGAAGIYAAILVAGYVKNAFYTLEIVGSCRRLILKISEKRRIREYEGIGIKGEEKEIFFSQKDIKTRISDKVIDEFRKAREKAYPNRTDIKIDNLIQDVYLEEGSGGRYVLKIIRNMDVNDIDLSKYTTKDICISYKDLFDKDVYDILVENDVSNRKIFMGLTKDWIAWIESEIFTRLKKIIDVKDIIDQMHDSFPYFMKDEIRFMEQNGIYNVRQLYDAINSGNFEEKFNEKFLITGGKVEKRLKGKNLKVIFEDMIKDILKHETTVYSELSKETYFAMLTITKQVMKAAYPQRRIFELHLDDNIGVNTTRSKKDIWTGELKEVEESRLISVIDVICPASFAECFHFSDKRINFRGKWVKASSVAEAEFKFLDTVTFDTGLFFCLVCDWQREHLEDARMIYVDKNEMANEIATIRSKILLQMLDDSLGDQDIYKKIIAVKDSVILKKEKEKETGVQAVLETFSPEAVAKTKVNVHIKEYNIGHLLLNIGVFILAFVVAYIIVYFQFKNQAAAGLGGNSTIYSSSLIAGIVVSVPRINIGEGKFVKGIEIITILDALKPRVNENQELFNQLDDQSGPPLTIIRN